MTVPWFHVPLSSHLPDGCTNITLPLVVTMVPRMTLYYISLLPRGLQYGVHVLGSGGFRHHPMVDCPLWSHIGVSL